MKPARALPALGRIELNKKSFKLDFKYKRNLLNIALFLLLSTSKQLQLLCDWLDRAPLITSSGNQYDFMNTPNANPGREF